MCPLGRKGPFIFQVFIARVRNPFRSFSQNIYGRKYFGFGGIWNRATCVKWTINQRKGEERDILIVEVK